MKRRPSSEVASGSTASSRPRRTARKRSSPWAIASTPSRSSVPAAVMGASVAAAAGGVDSAGMRAPFVRAPRRAQASVARASRPRGGTARGSGRPSGMLPTTRVPGAGGGDDRQLAADGREPVAHARQPDAASTSPGSKPAPSSRTSKRRTPLSASSIVSCVAPSACLEAFCIASRQQK